MANEKIQLHLELSGQNTSFTGGSAKIEREIRDHVEALFVTAKSTDAPFAPDDGIVLRIPVDAFDEYLAIENYYYFWCQPFFGKSLRKIPAKTQGLMIRSGKTYRCMLALCDDTWKTLLSGDEFGLKAVMLTNCEGITECNRQLALVSADGKDPWELFRRCAKAIPGLLGNGLKLRKERKYPEDLEYLGWCSWDAFQVWVSEKGLVQKVQEFVDKKVPIHFGIIDDMWADVPSIAGLPEGLPFSKTILEMRKGMMRTLDGDPQRFPNGMAGAIAKMKQAGMAKVGIWIPTTGYWKGIDPNGSEGEIQKDHLAYAGQDLWIVNPTLEHTIPYFDSQCRRIRGWDADFVKIDNQGMHQNYRNKGPIGKTSISIQTGIEKAVNKYFDGAVINCMGMPSECMFHRPDTAVSRCSDDFQPENREWFSKNVLQCSYNGLIQGQFYHNDWDMWWTDDSQALKNSLCRAVSGGPIYVSDKLGRTRPEILKPLALKDGRILRCDESAIPTRDCITSNPTENGKLFKIHNRVKDRELILAFNIQKDNSPAHGQISFDDLDTPADTVVVYDYFSETAKVLKKGESLSVDLADEDKVALFWIIPYKGVPVVLGRTDLFIGCKAILEEDNQSFLPVEEGIFGIYSEQPIELSQNNSRLDGRKKGNLTFIEVPSAGRISYRLI